MKKSILLILVAFSTVATSFAQRALSETVNYFDVRTPNSPLDPSIKTYKVMVEIPYTMTVDELNERSLAEFEAEKANYATTVTESEADYQDRLANHDDEVKKAEGRYDKEMADFKDLSLLERLALTDQGKKPALIVPAKPTYIKPREPQYQKPNLNDHLIFDHNALAAGVELMGYEKGDDLLFVINISNMNFQDNAGQTFYNQPTTLTVIQGTNVINEKKFDTESKFLTSSSSNTINLESYEKANVNKILREINQYINEEYGHIPVASSITIEFPKNKGREYDALENAKIKALSAFRKLNKDASTETRERAKAELMAVREIWKSELKRIDYADKKADMNKDVATMIFFNLMRVDISLKDKVQAEETLAAMQDKRIDLDLGYDDKITFTRLEEQVYKMN
ncbi:MAG: hypothetical protein ACSHXF_07555 [Aquaticitalea sp.]